jgi:ribosome-associated protein
LPRNRDAALERLRALIDAAAQLPRRRIATAPTRASKERRLQDKTRRGVLKSTRRADE